MKELIRKKKHQTLEALAWLMLKISRQKYLTLHDESKDHCVTYELRSKDTPWWIKGRVISTAHNDCYPKSRFGTIAYETLKNSKHLMMLLVLSCSLWASNQTANAAMPISIQPNVTKDMLGMHFHGPNAITTWPVPQSTDTRIWGTSAYWAAMSTATLGDGKYDFSNFDKYYNSMLAKHTKMIFTLFGGVPGWITTTPTGSCPLSPIGYNGSCYPPSDVATDGTGTNAHSKAFFTAFAQHIFQLDTVTGNNLFEGFEVANEPQARYCTTCTDQQLWREAADLHDIVKAINPKWLIISPAPSGGINAVQTYFQHFFVASNADFSKIDVIAFHDYSYFPGKFPLSIDTLTMTQNVVALMKQFNIIKPLWVSEGSFGDIIQTGFTDVVQQAGYAIQQWWYLVSQGVERYYWFAWDNGGGAGMITNNVLQPAGQAYQNLFTYLQPASCSQDSNGTVVCKMLSSTAIWNVTKDPNANSTCTPTGSGGQAFNPTTYGTYTKFVNLISGAVTTIQGSSLNACYVPIVLE